MSCRNFRKQRVCCKHNTHAAVFYFIHKLRRFWIVSTQSFRCSKFLFIEFFENIFVGVYTLAHGQCKSLPENFFIQLRAKITLKIQTTPHRVAYVYNTTDEVAEYGADTFTISRGMVNVMSEIRGIDTWVNFTETEGGVLCEIRSNKYNINPTAVKYGGGGHQKASGCTLKDQSEAMSLLADLNTLSEVEAHE